MLLFELLRVLTYFVNVEIVCSEVRQDLRDAQIICSRISSLFFDRAFVGFLDIK